MGNARFDFFHPTLQLGAGEIAVAVVHRLEFTAVDRNEVFREKPQLLTQHDKLPTDASNGLAVVFAKVGDGLEVRHQPTGKPHQFDVALRLALKAPARLDAIEIAVDVDLQHDCGVVSRSARFSRDGALKTQGDQVEFIHEDIDNTHRIGVADVIVQALGEQGTLTSVFTLNKAFHGQPLR
ncbi:hypothetical protein D3C73_914700 [compost metagenome]